MMPGQEFVTLAAQIQALLKEICREGKNINGQWMDHVDKTFDLVNKLHEESAQMSKENRAVLSVLETPAVNLWNKAVALKTSNSISAQSNAKLRNIAFQLVDYSTTEVFDDNTWNKKIMMGMKAGKAWLDCNEAIRAEQVLLITDQFVTAKQKSLVERKNENGTSDALEKQKMDSQQDVFKLLCFKSEAALLQGNHQKALDMVLLAKEMLPNFPKEGAYLSMLCYNFGVDMYQQGKYEESTMWLRESFELGKNRQSIGPKNQARTLRLLTNAYLESDAAGNSQKALNAITLANTEYPHPAGLYLRLRILLLTNESEAVIFKALEDVLRQSDVGVDLALNVVQLLTENKRISIALEVMKEMLKTFEQSPDLGKLLVSNLEILLQSSQFKEAKEFAEFCITGHNTGKPIDATTMKRLHLIFWEEAATFFEAKSYEESLEWYNYSLSLFSHTETENRNLAKLYRNTANCYLHLGKKENAAQAAEQAQKWEPDSVHTHFLLYKLALTESNEEKAKYSLKMMCEVAEKAQTGDDSSHSIICLAAQMAFEENEHLTACVALECLANSSPDNWQVLTALRCLIRLQLSSTCNLDGSNSTGRHIQTAYHKLLQLREDQDINRSQLSSETNWFMKIAWNMALQCQDNSQKMKELFTLCCKLSSLCPDDDANLTRQKTCLLMATAAGLEVARSSNNEAEKKYCLEEALHNVSSCQKLISRLQQNSLTLTTENKQKDTTEILLLLYEFEARVKLNDSRSEQVLEQALRLPDPDPKTFETLAALAMQPPAQNKNVSVRALKVALRKHLQVPQPDFKKASKLFHSLVNLALSGGVDAGTKEEALTYYAEIIDIIQKRAQKQYPEMEILWLMTKAWNSGINFFSCGRYDDAERWCSTSMKLLRFLDTMRDNYEDHMNKTYTEVMERMEALKARGKNMEE